MKVVPVEEERQKHRDAGFADATPAQGTTKRRAAWNELKDKRTLDAPGRSGGRPAGEGDDRVGGAADARFPRQAVRTLEDATRAVMTVPGETRAARSSGDVTFQRERSSAGARRT